MPEPQTEPVSAETADTDVDAGAAPVARPAGARSDLAVIGALLPYLRPYVGRITLALLLILGAKLLNLLVPVALKRIVDELKSRQRKDKKQAHPFGSHKEKKDKKKSKKGKKK